MSPTHPPDPPPPPPLELLPWTVNLADDVATPRMLLALHVYTPPSLGATSWIMSPPLVCTILLPKGRLEFCFRHVTRGFGFPSTLHWSDAIPVSFTTMDTGGTTIEGAEMDSPGSPLGPREPWSPLGPGGPLSPRVPLGPCGPWGPAGPCLPGGPGLPRFPLIPFGQCVLQSNLFKASWTSLLKSSRVMITLAFEFLFRFSHFLFWRLCVSATERKLRVTSCNFFVVAL